MARLNNSLERETITMRETEISRNDGDNMRMGGYLPNVASWTALRIGF
jgi:hypothetical protein